MESGRIQKLMFLRIVLRLSIGACLLTEGASAQSADKMSLSQLDSFSNSIQALASRVSPSVVRILATRYGVRQENGRADLVLGKQESIGSGVIVDPDGYVVTNAHVVDSAQRIMVDLIPKGEQTIPSVVTHSYAAPVNATLLGVFKEGDLALLKVAATHLPALSFADYNKLRQGQVVFAFGSPAGLENSVSMGVVSSIARQPDPDSPMLYIQTDTPINPGNSGGPLVNTAGEIVGLNTFIVTKSGGNEGVGFAIPSMLVKWVYGQLRKYGHVHRPEMGIGLQALTPTLAAALKLPRESGVIVSDVLPGGPAESAGLKVGDILISANGRPVDSVAAMMGLFFEHGSGTPIKLQVLRGTEQLDFGIVPLEQEHEADRLADLADPTKGLLPALGILGMTVDQRVAGIIGPLRINSGVIVAGRLQSSSGIDTGLQASDVIHMINGDFVLGVDPLKSALARLRPGDPVALLVERRGQLTYVAFDMQ